MMMSGRDLGDGENHLQLTEYIVANIQLMMFTKSSLSTERSCLLPYSSPPPHMIHCKCYFSRLMMI